MWQATTSPKEPAEPLVCRGSSSCQYRILTIFRCRCTRPRQPAMSPSCGMTNRISENAFHPSSSPGHPECTYRCASLSMARNSPLLGGKYFPRRWRSTPTRRGNLRVRQPGATEPAPASKERPKRSAERVLSRRALVPIAAPQRFLRNARASATSVLVLSAPPAIATTFL